MVPSRYFSAYARAHYFFAWLPGNYYVTSNDMYICIGIAVMYRYGVGMCVGVDELHIRTCTVWSIDIYSQHAGAHQSVCINKRILAFERLHA